MSNCATCKFWQKYREAEGNVPAWGFCLRYPPIPVAFVSSERQGVEFIETSVDQRWPETCATEWCGEFAAPASPSIPETQTPS